MWSNLLPKSEECSYFEEENDFYFGRWKNWSVWGPKELLQSNISLSENITDIYLMQFIF